jgi:quinol monooxygenase YgiN
MVAVIARLSAQDGKEAELEQLMAELAKTVLSQEEGCSLYLLCKGQEPGQYVMIERYASQEAFTAHARSAHFRDALPKLGALLQGGPQIEVLTEVG